MDIIILVAWIFLLVFVVGGNLLFGPFPTLRSLQKEINQTKEKLLSMQLQIDELKQKNSERGDKVNQNKS